MVAVRIEHRLGIAAPDHVVWEVLADLERWAEWNPFYVLAEGRLKIGERLSLTQAGEGGVSEIITPAVVDWVPDTQILLRLSQKAGLVQRLRYLEIEKLNEEACIFSNGEDWSGRLGPFVAKPLRGALFRGFEAMSEALSRRAISTWQARAADPTSQL